ncbi:MAG: ubiquinone/menaquinone biosynthesis methyltransferase [Nannocystaceae bacterium]|nr:ubiquinone/menaquinone biosynthesis methyltransferase [Nannocystaceae bacterium]
MSDVHAETELVTHDAHGTTVQGMFDRIAPGYDRANRWMSLWTDVRWRRRAVEALALSDCGTEQPNVLDLCAGTMDSSVAIHHKYPQASIIAGDFSAGMLDAGRHKLVGPVGERIEPRVMDAHALPVADASQHGLFCAFGVRNVSDLALATSEQARVLKPGGRLVILEFFRPAGLLARGAHGVLGATILPAIGWLATGDMTAYRYLPKSIHGFNDAETYGELLGDHGFDDVQITPLTLGLAWIVSARRRDPS